MADLNKEALDIWGSIKPMIDEEIASRTQGMVQRRKAKVTTAPSLVTNTIGVTEAFGQEIFLPFVTNIASAKVGDFVWIEWMYGASNAFVSCFAEVDEKDFTVAGVLDVVQRRCVATLSSDGWYRAITYNGKNGADAIGDFGRIFDISITRLYNDGNNEVHKISLLNPYNVYTFANESSRSNGFFVDGIRTVYNSDSHQLHIDIHYNSTRSNDVTVDFVMHSQPTTYGRCVAAGMANVTTLPAYDAVKTTYDFHANGDYTNTDLTVDGVLDVVPRRCYGNLPTTGNGAGWYKVMDFTGWSSTAPNWAVSLAIDFTILRAYNNNNNEIHKISFIARYNNMSFVNETSSSQTLLIDKIRYVRDGNNGHFDIHYATSSSNTCIVDFVVHFDPTRYGAFTAVTPTKVDDSPVSPATVLTEYTFAANTEGTITTPSAGVSGSQIIDSNCRRSGKVVSYHMSISSTSSSEISVSNGSVLATGLVPPDYMVITMGHYWYDTSKAGLRCQVTTAGNLQVYRDSGVIPKSGQSVVFEITYIAA